MTPRDLILNIAVNLSRIGRFIYENRLSRVQQFAAEANLELKLLKSHKLPKPLNFPISQSQKLLNQMSNPNPEDFFTYASILTHRSKLAV